MLRARLFGPLAVEVDGRAVPEIAGLRPRSVLAWLLLEPGPHSRDDPQSLERAFELAGPRCSRTSPMTGCSSLATTI